MAQKLEQTQKQLQTQQLATLQVAVAKMVELSVTELAARVRNEMLENAALEEKDDTDFPEEDAPFGSESDDTNELDEDYNAMDETDPSESDFNSYEADALGDYFNMDDVPTYLQNRMEAAEQNLEAQFPGNSSFYDELKSQIHEHSLTEHEVSLMEYLIGSLDEDGFLRKSLETLIDELGIYRGIETSLEEMKHLLKVLQSFEPRGIGARTLQECLQLQLSDPERKSPYTKLALDVVTNCFHDFANCRWNAICRRLNLEEDVMEHVKYELTHLNPHPGSALGSGSLASAPTIVPDFYVRISPEGEAKVWLNNDNVPELRVSRSFKESIKEFGTNRTRLTKEQKDAYTYARQKVEAAQLFINLVARRHEMLLSVMKTIVEFQRPFFDDDDEQLLKALTLKEVSEKVRANISTVSRVTNSKYVQTDYGIYPLKFFFGKQFTSESGEELTTRHVKAALRELIEHEDKRKPLADELLAKQLKAKGFAVARRTVAKYREQMGLPVARLRKG